MKPICVPCGLFYRVQRNGYYFEEGRPTPGAALRKVVRYEPGPLGGDEEAVRVQPGPLPDWTGYKLWVGDLWECRGCGHQIISGTGLGPLNEHYKPDYADQRARLDVTLRIDDC